MNRKKETMNLIYQDGIYCVSFILNWWWKALSTKRSIQYSISSGRFLNMCPKCKYYPILKRHLKKNEPALPNTPTPTPLTPRSISNFLLLQTKNTLIINDTSSITKTLTNNGHRQISPRCNQSRATNLPQPKRQNRFRRSLFFSRFRLHPHRYWSSSPLRYRSFQPLKR